jgi:protein-S-isoprenylcysteine O-methyltransferase Ste14
MYVGVIILLWGWALTFRSRALVDYTLLMMVVFYLRVVLFEEPWLAGRHGDHWVEYKSRVPRWLGIPRRRV